MSQPCKGDLLKIKFTANVFVEIIKQCTSNYRIFGYFRVLVITSSSHGRVEHITETPQKSTAGNW